MSNKIMRAVKWLMAITAFALIAIIFAGLALGWFQTKEVPTMSENGQAEVGGMELPEVAEGNGVSLTSMVIPKAEYAAYGVSAAAETAQTVTASVKSSGVDIELDVDWVAAWKNPSSEWATGKTVTSYVKVTPLATSGENSKKANVECLQAFGEEVTITCSVRSDAEKKATVSVHYVQKVENTTIKFGEVACVFSGNALTEFDFTATGYQGLAMQGKPTSLKYSVECSTPYTIPLQISYALDGNGCEPFSHSLSDERPSDTGSVKGQFGTQTLPSDSVTDYDWTSLKLIESGMPYSIQFLTENLYRYRSGRGTPPEYTKYTVSQLLADYKAYGTEVTNRKLFNVAFTLSCSQASISVTKKTTFCIGEFVDVKADSVSVDKAVLYY